jgi:hypothetical protein
MTMRPALPGLAPGSNSRKMRKREWARVNDVWQWPTNAGPLDATSFKAGVEEKAVVPMMTPREFRHRAGLSGLATSGSRRQGVALHGKAYARHLARDE